MNDNTNDNTNDNKITLFVEKNNNKNKDKYEDAITGVYFKSINKYISFAGLRGERGPSGNAQFATGEFLDEFNLNTDTGLSHSIHTTDRIKKYVDDTFVTNVFSGSDVIGEINYTNEGNPHLKAELPDGSGLRLGIGHNTCRVNMWDSEGNDIEYTPLDGKDLTNKKHVDDNFVANKNDNLSHIGEIIYVDDGGSPNLISTEKVSEQKGTLGIDHTRVAFIITNKDGNNVDYIPSSVDDLTNKRYVDKLINTVVDNITPIGSIIMSPTKPAHGEWEDIGLLENGQSIIGGNNVINGENKKHHHKWVTHRVNSSVATGTSDRAISFINTFDSNGDDWEVDWSGKNESKDIMADTFWTSNDGNDDKNRAWGLGIGNTIHLWRRTA